MAVGVVTYILLCLYRNGSANTMHFLPTTIYVTPPSPRLYATNQELCV